MRLSPAMPFLILISLPGFTQDTNSGGILKFRPLPIINYDPDNGMGYGVSFTLIHYGAGRKRHDWKTYASLGASTDFREPFKTLSPSIEVDLPTLRAGGLRWHFRGIANYRYLPYVPYYGSGDSDAATGYSPDKNTNYYYVYQASGPFVSGTLALPLTAEGSDLGIEAYAGASYESLSIQPSPKKPSDGGLPLLTSLRPAGYTGASLPLFLGGMVFDSRDFPPNPRSGFYSEIAGEWNPGWTGYSYERLTAILCFYLSPFPFFPNFTLAHRIWADALFGYAPFFIESRLGGTMPREGIGSAETVRGIPEHRYSGRYKFVGTFEARFRWLDFDVTVPAFEDDWHIENTLFVDTGNAWNDPDPAGKSLQFSWGAGLKILREEDSIYSFDFAFWKGEFRGVYVGFGHQF